MSNNRGKLQCQIALHILAKLQADGLLSEEEVGRISALTRTHYAVQSVWELS